MVKSVIIDKPGRNRSMVIPMKLGAGVALVAIGLAGLAFTVPLVSDGVSSEKLVYKEADVPSFPASLVPYVAAEVISAAAMTGGIALCAIWQGEALVGSDPPLRRDARVEAEAKDAKETEAA